MSWQAYRERLLAFVSSRLNNAEDAEDLVHDVLVRAYEKRDSLKDQRKMTAWLFQITRNRLVDYYRHKRPATENFDELRFNPEEQDAAAYQELAQCLVPFIERLPERYQTAIMLSEIEGLTQLETAEKLGLSHSGAKSRIQRGRTMLETAILACCAFEKDSRGQLTDCDPESGCNEA